MQKQSVFPILYRLYIIVRLKEKDDTINLTRRCFHTRNAMLLGHSQDFIYVIAKDKPPIGRAGIVGFGDYLPIMVVVIQRIYISNRIYDFYSPHGIPLFYFMSKNSGFLFDCLVLLAKSSPTVKNLTRL
jgi:hypothetical protein